jgi:hypothetical protein
VTVENTVVTCPFRDSNAGSSGPWLIIFPFAIDGEDSPGRLRLHRLSRGIHDRGVVACMILVMGRRMFRVGWSIWG